MPERVLQDTITENDAGILTCHACQRHVCPHTCTLVKNEGDGGWSVTGEHALTQIVVPMFLAPLPLDVMMGLSSEDHFVHWLMDTTHWHHSPDTALEGFITPGEPRLVLRDAVLAWLIGHDEVRCTSNFHVARMAPLERVGRRHPLRLANLLAAMQTGYCAQCKSVESHLIPEKE